MADTVRPKHCSLRELHIYLINLILQT